MIVHYFLPNYTTNFMKSLVKYLKRTLRHERILRMTYLKHIELQSVDDWADFLPESKHKCHQKRLQATLQSFVEGTLPLFIRITM